MGGEYYKNDLMKNPGWKISIIKIAIIVDNERLFIAHKLTIY